MQVKTKSNPHDQRSAGVVPFSTRCRLLLVLVVVWGGGRSGPLLSRELLVLVAAGGGRSGPLLSRELLVATRQAMS